MHMAFKPSKFFALGAVVLALTACGGGGGGGSSTSPGTGSTGNGQILDSFGNNAYGSSGGSGNFASGDSGSDGSAGDGLPIVGATVVITDASTPPNSVTVNTDSAGYYRARITGFKPPLIAKLTRLDGVVRYSVSTAALKTNGFVTMNITGLTSQIAADLAAANAAGVAALTPAMVTPAGIDASVQAMKAAILDVIIAAGLDPASFDPIAKPFVPNYTGYDFVLDNVVVPNVPGPGSTQPVVGFVPTNASGQSGNLALALRQANSLFASINAVYAGTPTAAQFASFVAPAYAGSGLSASTAPDYFASYPKASQLSLGGLAPYAGVLVQPNNAQAPNVSFDPNSGCVTSMWVKLNYNGFTHEYTRLDNTDPGRIDCTSGTWLIAGSQRNYHARITPALEHFVAGTQTLTRSGLFLETFNSETLAGSATGTTGTTGSTGSTGSTGANGQIVPYSTVQISGPGITTVGANGAPVAVRLLPGSPLLGSRNLIDDPYYGSSSFNMYYGDALEGSSMLQSCAEVVAGLGSWGVAATSSTPCLDPAAAVAGGDYTITYLDSFGNTLETDMQRLDASLPTAGLPASLYASITSVTPASGSLPSTGGTVTANWSLPAGIQAVLMGLNINDASTMTLKNVEQYVAATGASASIAVPALPAPVAGHSGLPGVSNSMAYVLTSVGGIMVLNAVGF